MVEVDKFEEYSLFIEDTARFSERRQTISNTYVAVNSLLLTAIGLLVKDLAIKDVWMLLLPLPLIISGIAVSKLWHQLICRYKALVGLRITILRDMEDKMNGAENMYHKEDALYPRDSVGTLIPSCGLNLSDIEANLPLLFISLYFIFGIGLLITIVIRLNCS